MDAARDVLSISPGRGKLDLSSVSSPYKASHRAMVEVEKLSVVHQVRATTVKVKLTSVTDQLQSIVDLETCMQ